MRVYVYTYTYPYRDIFIFPIAKNCKTKYNIFYNSPKLTRVLRVLNIILYGKMYKICFPSTNLLYTPYWYWKWTHLHFIVSGALLTLLKRKYIFLQNALPHDNRVFSTQHIIIIIITTRVCRSIIYSLYRIIFCWHKYYSIIFICIFIDNNTIIVHIILYIPT